MIFARDALLLARTKLRLRITRLSITIITSALLFAVLFFAVLFVAGSTKSALSFSKEGLGNRYIVTAVPSTYQMYGPDDKDALAALTPEHDALVAQKKAAAKKLDIAYDPVADSSLPLVEQKTAEGTSKYVNFGSAALSAYTNKRNSEVAALGYVNFQKLAKQFGATKTYQSNSLNNAGIYGDRGSADTVSVIVNNKETLANTQSYGPPSGASSITTLGWNQFDDELLKPFVLPGQNLAIGADGSIPVIAPMSAAEEILGLKPLSSSATSAEKLERLVAIRKNITSNKALICYRNTASQELYANAIQQQLQIEKNKNTKDYIAPSLIYNTSDQPCGAVGIAKDTRSAEEKRATENDLNFRAQFGAVTTPEQSTVSIRIVGITSDMNTGSSFSASQIIESILRSSLGTGWFSPASAVKVSPQLAKAMHAQPFDQTPVAKLQYYAEFPNYAAAKKFIKDNNCSSDTAASFSTNGPPPSGFPECVKKGKVFTLQPYGNNAGAIEDFRQGFWNFGKYAALVTVLFASIIMMGNLGKIIADSRRETAVFRALGAKRLDIAQIYITYSLLIATLVSAVAFTIGFIGALFVNAHYSPLVSTQAVLAFNSVDVHKKFTLFGLDPQYIAIIVALIFISAFISTLGPLLSNLRRNPIKDMRDEGA
jgi:ABC-type antimicrobial peptide transport system permease subunit